MDALGTREEIIKGTDSLTVAVRYGTLLASGGLLQQRELDKRALRFDSRIQNRIGP